MNLKKKDLPENLLEDIQQLIHQTCDSVAVAVNKVLTMLYWEIGKRIREEILEEEWAEYGKRIVSTLSRQLSARNNFMHRKEKRTDRVIGAGPVGNTCCRISDRVT